MPGAALPWVAGPIAPEVGLVMAGGAAVAAEIYVLNRLGVAFWGNLGVDVSDILSTGRPFSGFSDGYLPPAGVDFWLSPENAGSTPPGYWDNFDPNVDGTPGRDPSNPGAIPGWRPMGGSSLWGDSPDSTEPAMEGEKIPWVDDLSGLESPGDETIEAGPDNGGLVEGPYAENDMGGLESWMDWWNRTHVPESGAETGAAAEFDPANIGKIFPFGSMGLIGDLKESVDPDDTGFGPSLMNGSNGDGDTDNDGVPNRFDDDYNDDGADDFDGHLERPSPGKPGPVDPNANKLELMLAIMADPAVRLAMANASERIIRRG